MNCLKCENRGNGEWGCLSGRDTTATTCPAYELEGSVRYGTVEIVNNEAIFIPCQGPLTVPKNPQDKSEVWYKTDVKKDENEMG